MRIITSGHTLMHARVLDDVIFIATRDGFIVVHGNEDDVIKHYINASILVSENLLAIKSEILSTGRCKSDGSECCVDTAVGVL